MRTAKSLLYDEDGAEVLEFAIAASLFFTLLFGIIECSLLIYTGNFVAVAAQQGTRYAMVRGSDWTNPCASVSSFGCKAASGDVQNYVLSQSHPGVNLAASNITVTWLATTATGASCTPNSQGCQVEVKVSYPFALSIPFISTSIPLSSTSIETIQN